MAEENVRSSPLMLICAMGPGVIACVITAAMLVLAAVGEHPMWPAGRL